MHTIQERLIRLYGTTNGTEAMHRLTRLIAHYRVRIHTHPHTMSEKDAILITYGDQITMPGEAPLHILKNFLDHYLHGVINSVHLLPFFPYSSDDGFSVIDYKEVSPRMGSWKEVEAIGENFRLMVDGVINHVSQYSPWFKSYLADDPKFKDFFIDIDPTTDLSFVTRPRTSPLLSEFKDKEGRIRHIWTTFSKDQVDLNYANYKVLLAVLDALFYYVEKGATLIRLDAIAFVWKMVGTSCVHLPQTHELIQLIREAIHEVAPDVFIVTETNVPHDENISYFGSGDDEAQMVYNFALPPLIAHALIVGNTHYLTPWAKALKLPSNKVCFFNFTASHDGIGMRPVQDILPQEELEKLLLTCKKHQGEISYRQKEDGNMEPYELNCTYGDLLSCEEDNEHLRIKKFLLSQAIVLAMPGIPGIYFHSLIGAKNDYEGLKRTGMKRSINRQKFTITWLDEAIAAEGGYEHLVFQSYKSMLSIRTNQKAFNPFGTFEVLSLHPSLFVILRHGPEQINHILALHNCSNQDIIIQIPTLFHGSKELLTGDVIDDTLTMRPYQIAWLKQITRGAYDE